MQMPFEPYLNSLQMSDILAQHDLTIIDDDFACYYSDACAGEIYAVV